MLGSTKRVGMLILLFAGGLFSCTRPLGIWEAPKARSPCADMAGLDPDAPWPTRGRGPRGAGRCG